MSEIQPTVRFTPVSETDFSELADLRVAAMRDSLEQVGRFDPIRARERLRDSFYPEHTRLIVVEEKKAGFYTARLAPEGHVARPPLPPSPLPGPRYWQCSHEQDSGRS